MSETRSVSAEFFGKLLLLMAKHFGVFSFDWEAYERMRQLAAELEDVYATQTSDEQETAT